MKINLPDSVFILLSRFKKSNQVYPAPYNYLYYLAFIIFVSVIGSFIIFHFPILLLLVMIAISLQSLLNTLPLHWFLVGYIKTFMDGFIDFLTVTKLSRILFFVYEFWHGCLTLKGFKGFIILLYSGTLGYILITGVIFHYKIELIPIPLIIYILYFMFLVFLIIFFITNISFFVIPFIFQYYPQYRDKLLFETRRNDDTF